MTTLLNMRVWLGALLLWFGGSALVFAPAPDHHADPRPGIDVQHYAFNLTLADSTDRITGEAVVRVRFEADSVSTVTLDLVGTEAGGRTGMTVASVLEDSATAEFTHAADQLQIRPAPLPDSGAVRTYTIRYAGIPADGLIIATNQHGDRTFFGDNWPNRARHWIPSVDHPSDKATVEFIVTAPDRYRVVSNGALTRTTPLPENLRLTHWSSSAALPTKVMVIGVSDFAVDTVGTYDDTPIQSWVYPEDSTRGFDELAQARRILEYFETRIGNFPFEKLANVQSTTRYGGMENASAIFYSEQAIGDSQNDEPLLAHEIAHQWFGDDVTETDWPHLWLSEGFATYLTQLYLEDTYGRERLLRNMQQARARVFQYAQRRKAPVIDTLAQDPNTLLNPNSYQRGAWVLHMLRHGVGDSTLWQGLRTFYERYKGGNANTDDFQAVMEEVSGQSLGTFFEQWTRRAELPVVRASWAYDAEAGALQVTMEQVQSGDPFTLPVELGIEAGGGSDGPRIETLTLDKQRQTFTIPLDQAPERVTIDPNVRTLMQVSLSRE